MKRAAIFNPYWDTLGGGERYVTSFAKVLSEEGYDVEIEWNNPDILNTLEDRFGIGTSRFRVIDSIKRGDGYDLCFWVSDGSIPALKGRRNILHFQVPFHDVNGTSLMNKMKLFRIFKVVCNSEFTKRIIDKEFGIDSMVIYPPVDTSGIKPKRKENIILSVGRFSKLLQSKHQDILVKVFQKIYDRGFRDWKLILAGGAEVGDGDITTELKEMSAGYPIQIIKSPSLKELKDLYGRSKIFWSASGFGEDEDKNPQKLEHFGITIVEAMAAGNTVFAVRGGGPKEIIEDGSGFLWSTTGELEEKTVECIENGKLLREVSKKAKERSKDFSFEKFKENCKELL